MVVYNCLNKQMFKTKVCNCSKEGKKGHDECEIVLTLDKILECLLVCTN